MVESLKHVVTSSFSMHLHCITFFMIKFLSKIDNIKKLKGYAEMGLKLSRHIGVIPKCN